ncbi:uncharacterized protein LOC128987545 [Macrosteles quadrilineatus]|uniref:uncharacterized protein LOC128987545 n=1 Tax=Macrosteles quadrilineatus TaxID=74068 RepID=UPI0023E21E44|nr:uncharacterized protein LOC128987545 [Macrosteles quadrilineatus]XP_054264420.1 uncharacterized protein LOC128987545 [Macrosteles quadrilineatus]
MVTARIPELKDCGCGVSLTLGAKIISVIFFCLSSLIFLTSLYYIISTEIDLRNPDTEAQHHDETYKEVIAVMTMIVSGIHGTLAFLLWYGVKEHKPSYVLPWAILTTAFTMIFTFIAFLLLLHKFSFEQVIIWLIVVVMYYCVLIVYSHFRELRREKNLPQTLSNSGDAA